MRLPTKAQVDAASRHAISIAGTAIAIFGLQSKGIDIGAVTKAINALGGLVNDLVVVAAALAPLYALLKAGHSASPTSQGASLLATATGAASPAAVSAQKAIVEATSTIAQDKTIPKSEDAKNALVAATISLDEVQTIITDQKTADAIPSESVVAAEAVPRAMEVIDEHAADAAAAAKAKPL